MTSTQTIQSKPNELRHRGGEQARALRALVEQRSPSPSCGTYCHSIVVAGGKGGSGRSVIAANLAIGLAKRGMRVGLVDASTEYGSLGLLCGVTSYWKLSHVFSGCRRLDEVVVEGPCGVQILPGGNELATASEAHSERDKWLLQQLMDFESRSDWLVIDASGSGMETTRGLVEAADDLLIVATPEPTSIVEAYATVKSHASSKKPRLGLLVNQAESADQAQRILDRLQQAAHSFLQIDLHRRGFVPRDSAVVQSVTEQVPFVIGWPESAASQSLKQLAQRWTRLTKQVDEPSFMARVRKV